MTKRSWLNIERSNLRSRRLSDRAEYVGYHDGVWRITGHHGHWLAIHQADPRYAALRRAALGHAGRHIPPARAR